MHFRYGDVVTQNGYGQLKQGDSKVRDLTGLRVGRLTVISFAEKRNGHSYWKCKCDCGNYKIILGTSLTCKNPVKSCGCLRKEIAAKQLREWKKKEYEQTGHANNFKDLTGKHIKTFDVLEFSHTKNGRAYWKCKCTKCGTESIIDTNRLLNSNYALCKTCSRHKPKTDYTGKKITGYTVIKYAGNGKWIVRCNNCGKEKRVLSVKIKRDIVTACSCQKTHKTRIDITGNRYGSLVAKEFVGVKNTSYLWRFECDCGNKNYIADRSNVITGQTTRCNLCADITHKGSKAELEILEYIKSLNKDLVVEQHSRDVLCGKEIDIYIPSMKLGIEYNGSAFHATLNNVYENKYKKYHMDKFCLAKEKDIHLINIFDVDWEEKGEKIKKYLKDIICKPKVIYARKCTLEKITWEMYKEFCNKYHLQGTSLKSITTYMYGLYYEKELISVMGFGTPRFVKKNNEMYELHRYCVKSGYVVVGGAEKLQKYFIRECSPEVIRSYSDNDFFTGNIYPRLGYKFDSMVEQYYWYKDEKQLKRESCQVRKLKELYPEIYKDALDNKATNIEDYIMTYLGAKKVYRAGNTKWIWKQ